MKKYLVFSIPISLLIIGLFIYPTLYKYDKLQQNYPVKINRITGEAKILTVNGWINSGDYNLAEDNMLKYKEEIKQLIESQNNSIATTVANKIKSDIIADLEDEISIIKEEIEAYKHYEIDPDNSFTLGDSIETVKKVMGVPSSILNLSNEIIWYYDGSEVNFKNNKVTSWGNYSDNLRIK